MSRITSAWLQMSGERRMAALAALSLLVTMFLPWYGLQSLNRKTSVIYSHDISAFGDVSFVEAAIFLVAAGVLFMLLARAEGRQFHLPGGDGTIVALAGGWAGLLIFYRVFSRPSGDGYPVGIEWGFFLAFVAAGSLAYAGWRMRSGERAAPPVRRRERRADRSEEPVDPFGSGEDLHRASAPSARTHREHEDSASHAPTTRLTPSSSPARTAPPRERTRYPPAPPEQLSFEDPPKQPE